MIQDELLDLIFLGRPALANAHWPVYAARLLGYQDPFSLVPEDWAWWLRNFRGADEAIGWPAATNGVIVTDVAGIAAAAPVVEVTALSRELAQLEAELENA